MAHAAASSAASSLATAVAVASFGVAALGVGVAFDLDSGRMPLHVEQPLDTIAATLLLNEGLNERGDAVAENTLVEQNRRAILGDREVERLARIRVAVLGSGREHLLVRRPGEVGLVVIGTQIDILCTQTFGDPFGRLEHGAVRALAREQREGRDQDDDQQRDQSQVTAGNPNDAT